MALYGLAKSVVIRLWRFGCWGLRSGVFGRPSARPAWAYKGGSGRKLEKLLALCTSTCGLLSAWWRALESQLALKTRKHFYVSPKAFFWSSDSRVPRGQGVGTVSCGGLRAGL